MNEMEKLYTFFSSWSFFVAFHDVDKAENFFLSCSMQNVFFYVIYSPPTHRAEPEWDIKKVYDFLRLPSHMAQIQLLSLLFV